jgi:FkbM family methyltransferase
VNYRVFDHVPVTFRLFQRLIHWNFPGAWRLYRFFGEPPLKSIVAPFFLEDGSIIHVPLTWPGMLAGQGLRGYEPDAIAFFVACLRGTQGPVTLIDCGADIGVFARLVLAMGARISHLIAYEPNANSFQVLRMNLAGLSVPTDLRNAAVSSTSGRMWLVTDTAEECDHGAFLGSPSQAGLPVTTETIDQLQLDAITTVALKIDVEGEELAVLHGAATTLRQCHAFVVQFEAHPTVTARTGIDPRECLALLRSLGAEYWVAFCERSGEIVTDLSPDGPFFEQVCADDIYDVVAVRGTATRNPEKEPHSRF